MTVLGQAQPDVGEELASSRGGGGRRSTGGDKLRPYTTSSLWPRVVVVLVAALLAGADAALACPVCYGQAQGDVIEGAKLSVVFLGALVYAVIGGGVAVVLALRRRVRRNLDSRLDPRIDPHRGLRLIRPESGRARG